MNMTQITATLVLFFALVDAGWCQTSAAPLSRVVDAQGRELAEADWPPLVKDRLGSIRNIVFRMGEPYIHGSVVLARGVPAGPASGQVTMQLVGAAWAGGSLVWPKGDPGDHVIGLCLVERGGPFHLEVNAHGHLAARRELPDVMGALIWMGDVALQPLAADGSRPLTGSVEQTDTVTSGP